MSNYFTLDKTEKAVQYLADSEIEYSQLKASKETEKKRLEIVLAGLIMESHEKSHAMAETASKSHPEYLKSIEIYHDVLESFYLIEAKRARAETTIEVWRSVNAARGRGNPT